MFKIPSVKKGKEMKAKERTRGGIQSLQAHKRTAANQCGRTFVGE